MVLVLYRSLLRIHLHHLSPTQRSLGDAMLKKEFRLHTNIGDKGQAREFLRSWAEYGETLSSREHLPTIDPSKFTDGQLNKVRSLRQKIVKAVHDDNSK